MGGIYHSYPHILPTVSLKLPLLNLDDSPENATGELLPKTGKSLEFSVRIGVVRGPLGFKLHQMGA